jgi:hypothetical protein
MRRIAVVLAVGIMAGCDAKPASAPDKMRASPTTAAQSRAKAPSAIDSDDEPEADKEPPHFDPASGKKTLRWITKVTQPFRQADANRLPTRDDEKAALSTLAQAVQQTVQWRVPVAKINDDGTLSFAPFRTTAFPDHSEKRPEITLRIRAWNSPRPDSLFAFAPEPWWAGVRAGQDAVTVRAVITVVNFNDLYNWFVSLTDVQFLPDAEPRTSATLENKPPEKFDTDDGDRAFGWLRHQLCLTLDPFVTPTDRTNRKQKFQTQLSSLTGTRVRWRWPTIVIDDSSVAVQDRVLIDYPHQLKVEVILALKQPKPAGKSGSARAVPRLEYAKEYFGPPGAKAIDPALVAKIRESKTSTVSGKVSSIKAESDKSYPPSLLVTGVRLDDVLIEP